MELREQLNGIQHVGIPTNDIETTIAFYEKLGFEMAFRTVNHACMNIRLTSKASAGKQNFCPAEAFLLTLKQILPDSQKSANYPYRVKEMQNLSAVTKTGWSFYGNRAGNHCAFCT